MAASSGQQPWADEIISAPKMPSSIETQLLKKIEWVRNRRLELETLIGYEIKKNEPQAIDGNGQEVTKRAIPDCFSAVQPKLEDAIHKDAMYANIMKKLQISDMLEKIVMSSLDINSPDGGPESLDISHVQQKFGELMEDNLETSKKIILEHETISELASENIEKQLLLSRMAHERHALMQRYWKKKEKEDKLQEGMVNDRIKQLEAKITSATKVLTVHNHVLQLIVAYSGLDWSKDSDLLSIVLECGKPVDEQLSSVSLR